MNKTKMAVSLALLSMMATSTMAEECAQNFKEVDVTGTVTTQTLLEQPLMQAGSIDMQLTSVKSGQVLFDQTGAIVGEITHFGTDSATQLPVAFLDHDISFVKGADIETNGDRALIYGHPAEADVRVVEVISNFWGSKTFKNATGEIIATGTINIGGMGLNEFDLSGTLCIKP